MTLVLAVSLGARVRPPASPGRSTSSSAPIDKREVGKSDLPAMERLVAPMLDQTRALAQRLSPTGSSDRIVRRLDLAGNPGAWTVERVMGAKGVGLLVGAVLGLAPGRRLSLRGLLICAAVGARPASSCPTCC